MEAERERILLLMRPGAYPHPVSPVELHETHISWVLLAGEWAYKIKKPVGLGFLDFSTLSRRAHFCREELRLNRRYAADLYLDVVPVTGPEENPRFGGEGLALEYAVRMKRFPQESLLSAQLASGELQAERVVELAAQVARFHRQAEVAPPEGPFATPHGIRKDAAENLEVLERLLPEKDRGVLASLRSWMEETFVALCERFERRRCRGFVRECHGDLHLGNIIDWQGRILPFDGIEFNASFRWIDVLSDAAFVGMDLEDRGRPDFAHRFTNAYFEQSGDYEGLAVWRWYLVYRALVRAKVAAIRAAQAQECRGGIERGAPPAFDEAVSYLRLAQSELQPQRRRLIITHGVSGSGKTTGTEPLVDEGAVRVRSDVERKRLFGLGAKENTHSAMGKGIYSSEATTRTYGRLYGCAEEILKTERTAVVDATFLTRSIRDRFRDLAAKLGAEFSILAFIADEETLRRRIRSRRSAGTDASEATLEVLESQLAVLEPLGREENPTVLSRY